MTDIRPNMEPKDKGGKQGDREASGSDGKKGGLGDRKGSANSSKDSSGGRKGIFGIRKGGLGDRIRSMSDKKDSLTDRKGSIDSRKSSSGEGIESLPLSSSKSSLGDSKESLGESESNVGARATSAGSRKGSIGGRKGSVGSRKSGLSDMKRSIFSRKSSLSDKKGSVGSRKSGLSDMKRSIFSRKSSLSDKKGSVGSRKSGSSDIKRSVFSRKSSLSDRKGSLGSRKSGLSDRKGSLGSRRGSIVDKEKDENNEEEKTDNSVKDGGHKYQMKSTAGADSLSAVVEDGAAADDDALQREEAIKAEALYRKTRTRFLILIILLLLLLIGGIIALVLIITNKDNKDSSPGSGNFSAFGVSDSNIIITRDWASTASTTRGPKWCELNPDQVNCQNGATCMDADPVGNYTCLCAQGFYGRLCDALGICEEQRRDCNGHGECIDLEGFLDYRCECYPGYLGDECQDACDNEPSPYPFLCLTYWWQSSNCTQTGAVSPANANRSMIDRWYDMSVPDLKADMNGFYHRLVEGVYGAVTECIGEEYLFKVKTKTACDAWSWTDDEIWIQMHGTSGDCPLRKLTYPLSYSEGQLPFRDCSYDEFEIYCDARIGELVYIYFLLVGHDSWRLENITVESYTSYYESTCGGTPGVRNSFLMIDSSDENLCYLTELDE